MKASLLGALLLTTLAAVPLEASSHTVTCGFGDLSCQSYCWEHQLVDRHGCLMEAPERCPGEGIGFPPVCVTRILP